MDERDWSVPGADVLASLRELADGGGEAVVATIVAVEGSAYRRPGAKMLVEESGGGRGHITAGCLEEEVFDLAAAVLEADEPRVETYDLMEDDDDVWGLGVGCNGIIDVLLEPVDDRYEPLAAAVRDEEPIAVLTGLEGDVPLGAKAYLRAGSLDRDREFPAWLADAAEEPARALLESGRAESVTLEADGEEATVFVDGIRPSPRLAVFGTGHDIGPVVELARQNGFRVTVVSYRGGIDLEERFPNASEHVTTSPGQVIEDLELEGVTAGTDTYAVVMTHNFVDDRITLEALIEADLPYVGLLGPRERFEEMIEAFEEEGRAFSDEDLEAVYTPVGLNLGDGSPYGIATSIVAEVLCVYNDREPMHLSSREGPIHDRVELTETE